MENFRFLAEQTVAEAKKAKARLTDQALLCHDRIIAKERELSVITDEGPVAILMHQREMRSLRLKKIFSVGAIQVEGCIEAFDVGLGSDYFGRRQIHAWTGLALGRKRSKNVFLTIFFWYFAKGRKIPAEFWKNSLWVETPEFIRNDRDIVLARLCTRDNHPFHGDDDEQNHPSNFVPLHLWEDKAFVLATLQYFPEALEMELFPACLLDDRDVFLAFTQALNHREELRLLFQANQYCHLVQRFSLKIRTDPELMLRLVETRGLCLRYIDDGLLLEHSEIIRVACEKETEAWEYVSEDAKRPFLLDKSFVMKVLEGALNSIFAGTIQRIARPLYLSLPDFLQHDLDIVSLVLNEFQDIPATLPRTREFWLHVCETSFVTWEQFPEEYRDDDQFVGHIRFERQQEIEQYLLLFPLRVGCRTFWMGVIKSVSISGIYYDLSVVIQNHAPPEICRDRELMLLACQAKGEVFEHIDADLQADEDILSATIESYEEAFFLIPAEVQRLYPNLVLKAIQQVEDSLVEVHQVASDVWARVDVAKAVVENWRGELPPGFPVTMKSNEEFGLFATTYCHEASDFQNYTSETLRSDKSFMMQAVALNPVCLAAGLGVLSQDFDLAVMAFSRHICSFDDLFGFHPVAEAYSYEAEREFLYSVAAEARERVVTFEGFTQGFLQGMVEKPDSACNLPILMRDDATTKGLKELIAEFAGVPEPEAVDRLRATSLNLLSNCFPDPFGLRTFCIPT